MTSHVSTYSTTFEPALSRLDEARLIGHLLGRREHPDSVARALGLPGERVRVLCETLYIQGRLSKVEVAGEPLYSVGR